MESRKQRAYVKISATNQGKPIKISYKPVERIWEIDCSPGGPAVTIVSLGDEVVKKLLEARSALVESMEAQK